MCIGAYICVCFWVHVCMHVCNHFRICKNNWLSLTNTYTNTGTHTHTHIYIYIYIIYIYIYISLMDSPVDNNIWVSYVFSFWLAILDGESFCVVIAKSAGPATSKCESSNFRRLIAFTFGLIPLGKLLNDFIHPAKIPVFLRVRLWH